MCYFNSHCTSDVLLKSMYLEFTTVVKMSSIGKILTVFQGKYFHNVNFAICYNMIELKLRKEVGID